MTGRCGWTLTTSDVCIYIPIWKPCVLYRRERKDRRVRTLFYPSVIVAADLRWTHLQYVSSGHQVTELLNFYVHYMFFFCFFGNAWLKTRSELPLLCVFRMWWTRTQAWPFWRMHQTFTHDTSPRCVTTFICGVTVMLHYLGIYSFVFLMFPLFAGDTEDILQCKQIMDWKNIMSWAQEK